MRTVSGQIPQVAMGVVLVSKQVKCMPHLFPYIAQEGVVGNNIDRCIVKLSSYYLPDIFTIETILKCVKHAKFILAKNSLFVRRALMLVYKLQDKLLPHTKEKYSFQ